MRNYWIRQRDSKKRFVRLLSYDMLTGLFHLITKEPYVEDFYYEMKNPGRIDMVEVVDGAGGLIYGCSVSPPMQANAGDTFWINFKGLLLG